MKKAFVVKPVDAGGASWIMTFADLMTLLLTFFILLLSFSNLDAEKYRQIAYSMSQAFGVPWSPQSQLAPQIAPVLLLSPATAPMENAPITPPAATSPPILVTPEIPVVSAPDLLHQKQTAAAIAQNDALATNLIERLEQQVAKKNLSVSFDDEGVVISFTGKASFLSGSAELNPLMLPVLQDVVDELANCRGNIMVMGHTDDRPVESVRFRSNWDLSAVRAVSVVHQLVLDGRLNASNVKAIGLAETRPLLPNDNDENRARNRRVEMLIENANCTQLQ